MRISIDDYNADISPFFKNDIRVLKYSCFGQSRVFWRVKVHIEYSSTCFGIQWLNHTRNCKDNIKLACFCSFSFI